MLSWLANAWRVPELRRRVLFTAMILAIYRLGSWVPAPGIDQDSIENFFSSGGRGQGIFGLLNTFSGQALSRFSLFALGIMPYVTASIILPLIALGVIVAVVYIQEGQRRIPIQYAKRMVGRRQTAGGSTYMPLRVNMAGVIPVIFAAAVMAFPPTIAQFFPQTQGFVNSHFQPGNITYLLLEGFLIIIFTYFYTAVQFNPVDQADNLRKYGGYVPGIRPGPPTAAYFDRVLTRLTLPGSIYLAIVAVLPTFLIRFFNFPQSTYQFLGGTSLLIVVGVALDTMRQMESQMMMRSYEGFLK